jgi:single-strand DNA-binding protein
VAPNSSFWVTCGKLFQVHKTKKGSQVFIEGRIETSSYEDKDGNEKFSTQIIASQVRFMDTKSDSKPSQSRKSEPVDTGEEDLPF